VGLVIAFTWKFFPYIGMSVLGVLQGASTEFEMQAACLGLGKFKRFVHITLPLIVPATSIASIIVFAAAFGDYEIPAILGSSSHRMLSIYTYTLFTDSALMNKPHAYVLMILMTLVLMVIILLYRHLTMGMPTNAKGVEGGEGATGSRKRGSLRRVEVRDRATLGNRAGGANE
jgi:ABC-type Fe3+ transport system permease subunit